MFFPFVRALFEFSMRWFFQPECIVRQAMSGTQPLTPQQAAMQQLLTKNMKVSAARKDKRFILMSTQSIITSTKKDIGFT